MSLQQQPQLTTREVYQLRQQHIGKSLSIAYKKEPLHIVRGEKQYLFDESGREFLDCVNNVSHVGHSHPRITAAAHSQLQVLNTNTRYLNSLIVEYANRLIETLPSSLNVCYFVCSGSEANDLALRLASCWAASKSKDDQKKHKVYDVAVLDHAYHGHTQSCIDISPYKFNRSGGTGKPDNVHIFPLPDTYRKPDCQQECIEQVKSKVQEIKQMNRTLSTFIAESIPGCGGQVILPKGYLKEIYEIVRNEGALCIADEVQVGFGRVGSHFWAFETQDVIPDIVTMGKPIGNGFPLAAVVTTQEISKAFNNGMEYFNTFGGCNVAMAVGIAVLDILRDEKLQQHALTLGNYFLEKLQVFEKKYEIVGQVRGLGLFIGIEMVSDKQSKIPGTSIASLIIYKLKQKNILISVDGPFDNVLKIKPPMCFTKENVDYVVNSLDNVFEQISNMTFDHQGIALYNQPLTNSETPKNPKFTDLEAIQICETVFNIKAKTAKALPSYDDQNYLIETDNSKFVLKISNTSETAENLDFQNRVLTHVYKQTKLCQFVEVNSIGEFLSRYQGYLVRLLSFVEGNVFAKATMSDKLLFNVGSKLAKLDLNLISFVGDGNGTNSEWDTKNALNTIQNNLKFVKDETTKIGISKVSIITHFMKLYEENILEKEILSKLRVSLIHGDCNDYNIIVNETNDDAVGFIDFGDIGSSYLVGDLSIALAYVMMHFCDDSSGKQDLDQLPTPFIKTISFTQGYLEQLKLSDAELECIFPFIYLRLCVSSVLCSRTLAQQPENEYIAISQKGVWNLLELFYSVSHSQAHQFFSSIAK